MEVSPPPQKEVTARREPLSNEELGNLVASIGNSEAKALMAGEMRPNIIYGKADLQRLMIGAQGANLGWRIDHSAPWHWAERSLEPIGVVAREITDESSMRYGYMKTDYGEAVGTPLAGLLLDFSKRHDDISLYHLNGSTLASDQVETRNIKVAGEDVEFRKRAAATRIKMFWELTTADLPMRLADLSEAIGEHPNSMKKNLNQLSEDGIIDYTAIEGGKPFVAYKLRPLPEGYHIPHLKNYFTLSNKVTAAMQILGDRWLSLRDIEDEIMKDDPTWGDKPERSHASLRSNIASVLNYYKNSGHAELKDFQGIDRSKIDLIESQRALLTEYVELLEAFQRQDPVVLQKGRELFAALTPEDKANLMAKAEENSPFGSNRTSYQDTMPLVLGLVQGNPDASYNELRALLKTKYGKRLTPSGMGRIIIKMRVDNLVDTRMDGRTTRVAIKPTAEEIAP